MFFENFIYTYMWRARCERRPTIRKTRKLYKYFFKIKEIERGCQAEQQMRGKLLIKGKMFISQMQQRENKCVNDIYNTKQEGNNINGLFYIKYFFRAFHA